MSRLLAFLLCAGLAALLADAVEQLRPAPHPVPRAAAAPEPGVPEPASVLPAAGREMTLRPLFARTRRPFAEAAERPPAASAPAYRLVGTIRLDGRTIALLRAGTEDRVQRAVEGDRLGAWRVLHVEPGRVRITDGVAEQLLTAWPSPGSQEAGGGRNQVPH